MKRQIDISGQVIADGSSRDLVKRKTKAFKVGNFKGLILPNKVI